MTVDYRKFLGKSDVVVAPWWGGRSIDAPGRRLRLSAQPPKPGWFEFELKGRIATPKGAVEAPSLEDRPRVRGFIWRERLVGDGASAEVMRLLPEEEATRFSPVTARRWHGGALIFEGVEFETGPESTVRELLVTGTGLKDQKGVPAPLRAAFAYVLIEQTARRLGVPVAASEVRPHVGRVADEGAAGAEAIIRALIAEREETEREMRELRARIAAEQVRADLAAERQRRIDAVALAAGDLANARAARRGGNTEDRVFEALEKAGAQFESMRQLNGGEVEVVFGYMDERFISIVNSYTLQVIDSGICLGHPPADDLITLESLPAVIKEAIDTGRLVILRAP
ncbi:MAG: hypothetical protein QM817_07140 [Archangium sp.]